jgi:hypothetical protein
MATYYSNRVSSTGGHYIKKDHGLNADYCIATDASTALVLNDTIKLFTVPEGAVIVSLGFGGTAKNSGNDRVVTVGDAGDTDRFFSTAQGTFLRDNATASYNYLGGMGAVNHSGTGSSVLVTRGYGYKYTADTDLIVTVTTAGTGTAADWVLTCMIQYYVA